MAQTAKKKLFIFEGAGKRWTLLDLMKKGEIEQADLGFTSWHILKIKGTQDGKAESLGVNLETFRPTYGVIPEKTDLLQKLKAQIERADEVVVFTDPDYEGEVIAFSLWSIFKEYKDKMKRAVSQEISGPAIRKALNELKPTYDTPNADAGMIRAVLDRIIGWAYSTVVYKKGNGELSNVSAGRCQSPTLKFLTERELEIENFKPSDYYSIQAEHKTFQSGHILNKTVGANGKNKFTLEERDVLLQKLKGATEALVNKVERSFFETSPKEPFNNASFMSACASVLNFTPKQTTELSQKLYESGYVSYIRTDAIELEPEKIEEIRQYIKKFHWEKSLSKEVIKYKNPESAQASHMAIAPVNLSISKEQVQEDLWKDAASMYQLIFDKALSSQMANVVTEKQTVTVSIKGELFQYVAKSVVDNWFRKVWKYTGDKADEGENDSSGFLTEIKKGDVIPVTKIKYSSHKTKAPARYNVASCITKMDKLRVGRPSTTATIINTLKDRGYIVIDEKGIIKVSEKGKEVCNIINDFASEDIMDFDFTKRMEDLRDDMAKGKVSYLDLATQFYTNIENTLKNNGVYINDEGFVKIWTQGIPTGRDCPLCDDGKLERRIIDKGEFLICSNNRYKDSTSKCSYFNFFGGTIKLDEKCKKCWADMRVFTLPSGQKIKKCEFSYWDWNSRTTVGCKGKVEFL